MIQKLVAKNLRVNRKNNTTFVLSNALVYAIIFVLYSLTKNDYVLTRNAHLTSIMQFVAIVLSVIAVVFTLYSQRFMFKKRSRELSLYQVLGLEKKHISKMLLRESLIIFVFASLLTALTGYVIGVLSFLLLRNILNITLDAFSIFEFNIWALVVTVGILFLSFLLNVMINIASIAGKTPVELIHYEKDAEKEPKVNVWLLVVGLICLSMGYAISLTMKDPLNAILWLFVAVVLVIIASYCLFVSLSIFSLKMMRRNKKYYFKKENFLSISNLLYRLKSNAVSLATITVLCSAVIMTISVSYTIGTELEKTYMDDDYELTYSFAQNNLNQEEIASQLKAIDKKFAPSIDRKYLVKYTSFIETTDQGDILLDANPETASLTNAGYVTVTTQDYYEKAFGVKLDTLKDDEIYYVSTNKKFNAFRKIKIDGKTYSVKPVDDKSSKNIVLDKTFIVTKDFKTFEHIITVNSSVKHNGLPMGSLSLVTRINEKDGQDLSSYLRDFAQQNGMEMQSKREQREFLQEFSGGFFFLGVLMSIVLTIITSMVLYYKQISEAEQDRRRYAILKKLGVSEKMAKKTIQRQMRSVFLSPVIVAVIHNLVAGKMIAIMLRLFHVTSYWVYFSNFTVVAIIFVAVYIIAYRLSKRAYENIVWREATELN